MRNVLNFSLIAVGLVGCLQPAPQRFAQQGSLEDSIRFTQLTVVGKTIIFQLARDGVDGAPRMGSADPIDFPEYATFQRMVGGGLQLDTVHTRMNLSLSPKCVNADCTEFQIELSRGETIADKVTLQIKQIKKVTCAMATLASDGSITTLEPVFENISITTIILGDSTSGRNSIYAKTSYFSPVLNRTISLFVRNFVGALSELWVDRADGTATAQGTTARTRVDSDSFTAENPIWDTKAKTLYISGESSQKKLSLDCHY